RDRHGHFGEVARPAFDFVEERMSVLFAPAVVMSPHGGQKLLAQPPGRSGVSLPRRSDFAGEACMIDLWNQQPVTAAVASNHECLRLEERDDEGTNVPASESWVG